MAIGNPRITPQVPGAKPVLFLTSCGIYPYDDKTHADTRTKSYYPPTGRSHLLNTSAAVLLEALETDTRVIIQTEPHKHAELQSLINLHPQSSLVTLIPAAITSPFFVTAFYQSLIGLTTQAPVSRVDFCLYNSYSQGTGEPFIPIFEEDTQEVSKIAAGQIVFFQTMGKIALDLLTNRGQESLQFMAVTSLASRRMLAHLYADAVHKTLASVYLQGFAYEAPHYTGKRDISVIELMPGMVDTGTYDSPDTRKLIVDAEFMEGFPFEGQVSAHDVNTWPMIPPADLGKIAAKYLWRRRHSTHVATRLNQYTCAGCPVKKLKYRMEKAVRIRENLITIDRHVPEFCFCTGVSMGKLPRLRTGYIPIPLSPLGQYF